MNLVRIKELFNIFSTNQMTTWFWKQQHHARKENFTISLQRDFKEIWVMTYMVCTKANILLKVVTEGMQSFSAINLTTNPPPYSQCANQ